MKMNVTTHTGIEPRINSSEVNSAFRSIGTEYRENVWTNSTSKVEPDSQFDAEATTQGETKIHSLSLISNTIVLWMSVAVGLLIFANSAVLYADFLTGYSSVLVHKLVKLFYVELELNIPAFFSMLILLFATLLIGVITFLKKKDNAQYVFEWSVLSLGFLLMAFDEIASIHERLIEPVREIIGENNLGVFYFAWVIPAVILITALGFFFLRFLWNLPSKTRFMFIIAAAIYLGGAVGLEMIEGWYSEVNGRETLVYMFLTTLEETLEMLGTILFIRALLNYIAENYKNIEVELRG